jgi:hypothetical protein
MNGMQTVYQAYNESHPECKPDEKHGIIHDFKESLKEVVQQIKGKEPKKSTTTAPAPVQKSVDEEADDEVPEFSKSGRLNRRSITQYDANNQNVKDFLAQFSSSNQSSQFAESIRSLQSPRSRKHSKHSPNSTSRRQSKTVVFDASGPEASHFSESIKVINKLRKQSKNEQEIFLDTGEDIIQIKVMPKVSPFSTSENGSTFSKSLTGSSFDQSIKSVGKLVDAGKHVEVFSHPPKQ